MGSILGSLILGNHQIQTPEFPSSLLRPIPSITRVVRHWRSASAFREVAMKNGLTEPVLCFPVLGPKYYTINGIWALKPHYLGPWTLKVCFSLDRNSVKRGRPLQRYWEAPEAVGRPQVHREGVLRIVRCDGLLNNIVVGGSPGAGCAATHRAPGMGRCIWASSFSGAR